MERQKNFRDDAGGRAMKYKITNVETGEWWLSNDDLEAHTRSFDPDFVVEVIGF